MSDYWFLCTPFSLYPKGLESAYILACRTRALLIDAGVLVFSPICHSFGPAVHGSLDPLSHDIWLSAEAPFRHFAKGAIMLMSPGWGESYGMKFEQAEFEAEGKPIIWMTPGEVPKELLSAAA